VLVLAGSAEPDMDSALEGSEDERTVRRMWAVRICCVVAVLYVVEATRSESSDASVLCVEGE
jgi:hypothetical protein